MDLRLVKLGSVRREHVKHAVHAVGVIVDAKDSALLKEPFILGPNPNWGVNSAKATNDWVEFSYSSNARLTYRSVVLSALEQETAGPSNLNV